jgi:CorA-like Mg2+ transporter protein
VSSSPLPRGWSVSLSREIGSDIEAISARVFTLHRRPRHDFRGELGPIGQGGEPVSKARESLVSLSRLLGFLQQTNNTERITAEARASLHTVSGDVVALSYHATFLGDKVQFLLDATLGMVQIDQNNILKIFSVAAVLLPPSVIGAFYGMNFGYIPWLHESWGVWAALALMVVSALAPYAYFRRKGCCRALRPQRHETPCRFGKGRLRNCAPDWIRTSDLQLRRLPLYPTELRARGAGDHTRRGGERLIRRRPTRGRPCGYTARPISALRDGPQ